MKKTVLTIFLILLVLSIGTYYTYVTDKGFKRDFDRILNRRTSPDSTSNPQKKAEQKTAIQQRKKIRKLIKTDPYYQLDEYARKTPKQYEKDVETLAHYLITPAKSEIEKVRLLFTWVATHINYDAEAFNSGNLIASPAENVLQTKKAVCDGFGNLLKELCSSAGLESEKISGYSKGYSYHIGDKFKDMNHAWNAVKIDNQWRLFDATCARGYGTKKNGKLVSTNKFNPYWFDVNPKELIFTHLHEESKWQLLKDSLTIEKFETLPYLRGNFFELGFDSDSVFSAAVSGDIKEFAEVFSFDYPVKAVRLPYVSNLKRNDVNDFVIQSDYAELIALIDGSSWHFLSKREILLH